MNKLKALIQWFVELQLQEHGHWCVFNFNDDEERPTWKRDAKRTACPHQGYRWKCFGVFCAGIEIKNCPACEEWDKAHRHDLEVMRSVEKYKVTP